MTGSAYGRKGAIALVGGAGADADVGVDTAGVGFLSAMDGAGEKEGTTGTKRFFAPLDASPVEDEDEDEDDIDEDKDGGESPGACCCCCCCCCFLRCSVCCCRVCCCPIVIGARQIKTCRCTAAGGGGGGPRPARGR